MRQQCASQTQSLTLPLDDAELRRLSRSPHPYHRQNFELPHGLERITNAPPFTRRSHSRSAPDTDDEAKDDAGASPKNYQASTSDDSGTEADDEHFLRGLPASRLRPHKGVRGIDGTPSPLLSPAIFEQGIYTPRRLRQLASFLPEEDSENLRKASEWLRKKRKVEIVRRMCEIILLSFVGYVVCLGEDVRTVLHYWRRELWCLGIILTALLVCYPFRILRRWRSDNTWNTLSLAIPAIFDPAPLIYPPAITLYVAAILSVDNILSLLPSMVLAISSLPRRLIPCHGSPELCNVLQWCLSVMPVLVSQASEASPSMDVGHFTKPNYEMLVLIHPLHQALCYTLRQLTTTSLLSAELQLLSVSLINLLLLAQSPQAIVLKALLWIGGTGILISSTHVLKWTIILARVPRWRFRQSSSANTRANAVRQKPAVLERLRYSVFSRREVANATSDDDVVPDMKESFSNRESSGQSDVHDRGPLSNGLDGATAVDYFSSPDSTGGRITSPTELLLAKSGRKLPSGRRKRTTSSSLQPFLSLTSSEASVLKWIYATYIYACIAVIVLVGVRGYVGEHALNGQEPIGWALGYMFGDIDSFRLQVVTSSLHGWIFLPIRFVWNDELHSKVGWVQSLRQTSVGEANTRLLLSAYWFAVIIIGLVIVVRLSAMYEVDTRRKVFHLMMVAMLLPATYVDPTFAALALSLTLAIFLLLDLFRACQLPPLSKHLAYFLTPYVDGRDLKGPVVISHIFLLIGCAIPLWLTLGSLPRIGTLSLAGWEVSIREVSMVSGVICVGMGDAAASLIGRRYGRHKWFWSGGKSIEGSVAFASAVWLGLCGAKVWLRFGGWMANNRDGLGRSLSKAGVAAMVASLTEAVLTGGNDNVIVPVVLWLCVKGLDL